VNSGGECLGERVYERQDVLLVGSKVNVKDLREFPLKPDVCVVASRHKSESQTPTLTCHPTGNFGGAELGGEARRLQLTDANYLRESLTLLRRKQAEYVLPYEVSREVTHHGPTDLPFPLLYVEVGSSERQWGDLKACQAAAEVILDLMFNGVEQKKSAIGFGGPHYAPNFNDVTGEYAVGHIMPKYAAEHMSAGMVSQMIEKTTPKPEAAVVDWKGLRGIEKERLSGILEELDLPLVKTSDVK